MFRVIINTAQSEAAQGVVNNGPELSNLLQPARSTKPLDSGGKGDCIEDKLDSNQRNKAVFLLEEELTDSVFCIYSPSAR